MGKLNFKPREITSALEGKLGINFRDGKERIGYYVLDGKMTVRFKIPHIHPTWGPGTIKDIIRKSLLSRDEFALLVACPLNAERYEQLVRERSP